MQPRCPPLASGLFVSPGVRSSIQSGLCFRPQGPGGPELSDPRVRVMLAAMHPAPTALSRPADRVTAPQTPVPLRGTVSEPPAPAGGSSASVQCLETSVQRDAPPGAWEQPAWLQSHVQHHVHRRWMATRRRLWSAWWQSGEERLARRAEKLAMCCCSPQAVKLDTGDVRTYLIRCRDRLCPHCSARRSADLGDQLGAYVRQMDSPRHVVLTAPAVRVELGEQLRSLRAAFRRLRKSELWRRTQRGGVYSIEITRNARTGLWHPHIHVVADGDYTPHHSLRDQWSEAVGRQAIWADHPHADACICHISAVHSASKLGSYVAKYVVKPTEIGTWPGDSIVEYAEALHGVRLVHTFGSLHGVNVKEDPEPNEAIECGPRIAVLQIISLARSGCRGAIAAVGAARAHGQAWADWCGVEIPDVLSSWVDLLAADVGLWWSLVERLDRYGWSGEDQFIKTMEPPKPPDPWLYEP